MKLGILKFFIILLQFVHGTLVMKMEWDFITELLFIILPFSVLGAVLFSLYDNEIKKP